MSPDNETEPTQTQAQESSAEESVVEEPGTQDAEETPEALPEEDKPEEVEDKPAEATAGGDGEESRRKRAGGWQRKIERLERQNAELLALVTHGARQSAEAKPDKEKTPQEKADDYVRAVARQEWAQLEQLRREQAARAEFEQRTAEVRAKRPDFDEVVASVAHIPVPDYINRAILKSKQGSEIMYQLASNPAELSRLADLPAEEALLEIGALGAKLASSTATPKTTKPALRPPAPPTSVSGSASSTRSLDDLPISEYKRAMRSGRR